MRFDIIKKQLKKWRAFVEMANHFLPYVKKQKGKLLPAMLCGISYTLFGMLEPWPLKIIFDSIFYEDPLPKWVSLPLSPYLDQPIVLLNILVVAIIFIALIRGLFYYYQQLLTSRAGQQIVSSIRVDLYDHLQHLSFTFHDRKRTGDLLARLTTDIRILREILISIPLTVSNELLLMGGMLAVMAYMDLSLALLAMTVIPILGLLLKKYKRPMKQAIRQQREREGHLTSVASEVLGAIKVVQGFHQEGQEIKKFSVQNSGSLKTGLRASRLEAKLKWASELSVAIVTAVIIGIAGRRVMDAHLTPGDLIVFAFYLKTFNRPLRRISSITERMARGTSSGERIWDMLQIPQEISDAKGTVKAAPFHRSISFNDVSFKYRGGKSVLNHINLNIYKGERIAIIGATGSGKSTIANLLPRFYTPTAGTITIDGININKITLKSLREQIAIVFQEPVLFATSIAENIAYGKPGATAQEIKGAAKKAHINGIIEALPEGYETQLGERGGTLSGGQRQCVSIARAIIKDAPIVILDEPTSGLDLSNALLVMEALKELMKEKTVIIISHQHQTIADVDHVYEIENGVIQQGNLQELQATVTLGINV